MNLKTYFRDYRLIFRFSIIISFVLYEKDGARPLNILIIRKYRIDSLLRLNCTDIQLLNSQIFCRLERNNAGQRQEIFHRYSL